MICSLRRRPQGHKSVHWACAGGTRAKGKDAHAERRLAKECKGGVCRDWRSMYGKKTWLDEYEHFWTHIKKAKGRLWQSKREDQSGIWRGFWEREGQGKEKCRGKRHTDQELEWSAFEKMMCQSEGVVFSPLWIRQRLQVRCGYRRTLGKSEGVCTYVVMCARITNWREIFSIARRLELWRCTDSGQNGTEMPWDLARKICTCLDWRLSLTLNYCLLRFTLR